MYYDVIKNRDDKEKDEEFNNFCSYDKIIMPNHDMRVNDTLLR